MNINYNNQIKNIIFSSNLSKLRQKLGQLIKSKSKPIGVIFGNLSLIKGGVYTLNRKCGKPSCKCATTSYRHSSSYLYKSEHGKNIITYLKDEVAGQIRLLTNNYIKFRQARAQLIKNEKEIMNIIDQIEKERTIPFIREGKNGQKRHKRAKKNKKK